MEANGEWTKCYNPANGEMHEWEIWRDGKHEDEYFASCPSEEDADTILAALTAQAELTAAQEHITELEQDAEFDDQSIHVHIAHLKELGDKLRTAQAEADALKAKLIDTEKALSAEVQNCAQAIFDTHQGRLRAEEALKTAVEALAYYAGSDRPTTAIEALDRIKGQTNGS